MDYYFEKWWKDRGRYEEIVNKDFKNEEVYKKFAEKIWKEAYRNSEPVFYGGHNNCGCD